MQTAPSLEIVEDFPDKMQQDVSTNEGNMEDNTTLKKEDPGTLLESEGDLVDAKGKATQESEVSEDSNKLPENDGIDSTTRDIKLKDCQDQDKPSESERNELLSETNI